MKICFVGKTTAPNCFTEDKQYEVLEYEPSTFENDMPAYLVVGDDGYRHYVLGSGCAYLTENSTWKEVE